MKIISINDNKFLGHIIHIYQAALFTNLHRFDSFTINLSLERHNLQIDTFDNRFHIT
jgi:hypothetical protein